ncbi:mechanosensitive ion channel family protein [bacterium]|nr:mechanosensitive ion channel family protein [bacterium]
MQTLLEALKDPLLHKFLYSALSIFITVFFLLFLRRLLIKSKFKKESRFRVLQWSVYGLVLLNIVICVRIWTGSGFLTSFRNDIMTNLIRSGVALLIIYTVYYFIRRFINSLQITINKKHEYRKRAGYTATVVFLLMQIPIWAGSTQHWATVLSVMGAGIALALHEVLLNLAGWFYILFRRPYRTGDRIELGQLQGDVIDISVMQTTLLEIGNWVDGDQSTGRVVHMPHGQIFRVPLYNYTQGFEFIWNELSVLITFESNWESAKALLHQFGEEESKAVQETVKTRIDKMSREYLIYYRNFTPIVYTRIEDSGVKLTLRYLTEAKKRRNGIDAISRKMLKAVSQARDVEFAYPTVRVYRQDAETRE